MTTSSTEKVRRYDIDWLRVLAVLLLVPFHTALIFSLNPNDVVYVKDTVESQFLLQIDGFIYQWHMPLLFVLAGASTWFALGFRSSGQYLKERFLRLLIPGIFGMVTLIPMMLYLHLIWRPIGSPYATFLDYYPHFFQINPNDLVGYSGTMTPSYLWFIFFLFVFSIVALPLFRYLRGDSGRRLLNRLAVIFEKRGAILLPGILITIMAALPGLVDKNPFFFIAFFILGYVFMADERFQQAIDRDAWLAFGFGLAAYLVAITLPYDSPQWSATWIVRGVFYNFNRWLLTIAFLGLGHKFLNRSNRVLRYATEAAYPFYILHLPIDTLVALFIVRLEADVAVKYVLINLITIALTLGVYEIVKRVNLLRFLFGMKAKKPIAIPVAQPIPVN